MTVRGCIRRPAAAVLVSILAVACLQPSLAAGDRLRRHAPAPAGPSSLPTTTLLTTTRLTATSLTTMAGDPIGLTSSLYLACCPAGAWAAGQLMVAFTPGVTNYMADFLARQIGASVIRRILNLPAGPVYLMSVPAGQERDYITRFAAVVGVRYAELNYVLCFPETPVCECCCPAGAICPSLPPCATLPADPHGSGFWKHQCGDNGYQSVSPQELSDAFELIGGSSIALQYCGAPSCESLQDPAGNDMRAKLERQLQALWLNAATCRISTETRVDLPALTAAATVGEALYQIEGTFCNGGSGHAALERAKDIAEAINGEGDDFDLFGPATASIVGPGGTVALTLGLVNLGSTPRSYELAAGGPWPAAIAGSPAIDLGAGGYAPVVVEIEVPVDAEPGASVIVQVSAADTTALPARRHLLGLTLQLASPRERLRTGPQESVP